MNLVDKQLSIGFVPDFWMPTDNVATEWLPILSSGRKADQP
jgi:hypothetical protein